MSASDIENASYDEAWQRIAELADDLSNHHDFKVAERVTELLDWLDAVHREGLGRGSRGGGLAVAGVVDHLEAAEAGPVLAQRRLDPLSQGGRRARAPVARAEHAHLHHAVGDVLHGDGAPV